MATESDEDPIVAEVRENRRRLFFEECQGDWNLLFARWKALEEQVKDRLVTYEQLHGEPEPPLPAAVYAALAAPTADSSPATR